MAKQMKVARGTARKLRRDAYRLKAQAHNQSISACIAYEAAKDKPKEPLCFVAGQPAWNAQDAERMLRHSRQAA